MTRIIPYESVRSLFFEVLEEAQKTFILFFGYEEMPETLMPLIINKTKDKPAVKVIIVLSQLAMLKTFPKNPESSIYAQFRNVEVRVIGTMPNIYIANEHCILAGMAHDKKMLEPKLSWMVDLDSERSQICIDTIQHLEDILLKSELVFKKAQVNMAETITPQNV